MTILLLQRAVQSLGSIDTLILNHVDFGHMAAWRGTDEQLEMFETMIDVDLKSYVHVASHALPYLKSAPNGRLSVMSSIAGI